MAAIIITYVPYVGIVSIYFVHVHLLSLVYNFQHIHIQRPFQEIVEDIDGGAHTLVPLTLPLKAHLEVL